MKISFRRFAIILCPSTLFLVWFGAYAQAVASSVVKLPYAKGESFVVTQGYDSPPTHIKKDEYALDFTQDGCSAYGKLAVAAISGKAWVVEESGYNGGYGTQILVLGDGNTVSRYAHLVPGSVPVGTGDSVAQGMVVGEIGDTGLVMGTACAAHPGTHIHFAMDTANADGSFSAKNPEPISGYTDIAAGNWYLSDNEVAHAADAGSLTAIAGEHIGASESSGTIPAFEATTSGGGTGDGLISPGSADLAPAPEVLPGQPLDMEYPADNDIGQSAAVGSPSGTAYNVSPSSSPDTLPSFSLATSTPDASAASSSGFSSGGGSPSGGTTTLLSVGSVSVVIPPQSSGDQGNLLGNASSGTITEPTASSTPAGDTTSTTVTTPPANATSTTITTSTTIASSTQFVLESPGVAANATSLAGFDSSTLAIDFSWQAPHNASGSGPVVYNIFSMDANNSSSVLYATTTNTFFTYPIADAEFGTDKYFSVQAEDGAGDVSALATTTITVPAWFSTIQPYDGNDSRSSWYDDNWYDLGTGLFGTIRSLNLEGYINSDSFGSSTLALQEFSDPGYTTVDHAFPISDDAPFRQTTTKITIGNLKIPLQPQKYYRLTTYQDYQNRSVVLRGTDATGTAMWDNFVYGQGGVEYQYPFYPYLSGVIIPEDLPLAPPVMQGDIATSFNAPISRLTFSWPVATDPDEPLVGPSYQINISTSTAFDSGAWRSVGGNLSSVFTTAFPNTYLIGVRALDDFGTPSAPTVLHWNFPSDYAPPPTQPDHSAVVATGVLSGEIKAQEVTFAATTTARSVDFWMAPVQADYSYYSETQLAVYGDNGGVRGDEIPSENPKVDYGLFDGPSEGGFTFASPITFSPGSYWFVVSVGPRQWDNPTTIYGSPGGDAYYRFEEPTSL